MGFQKDVRFEFCGTSTFDWNSRRIFIPKCRSSLNIQNRLLTCFKKNIKLQTRCLTNQQCAFIFSENFLENVLTKVR